MNIWLPYPNFKLSARVLRTEDLLDLLHDIETGLSVLHQTDDEAADVYWNDPVVQAWRGHEAQLAEYGLVCVDELTVRVYTIRTDCVLCMSNGHRESLTHHQLAAESGGLLVPDWFGNVNLHTSHQSDLLRRDAGYYRSFFEFVRDDVPVQWWPQADAS